MDRVVLADMLAELSGRFRVPGAQLALRQNGLTTSVTYGELVAGTGIAVEEDSAFPLGSLTKPFTATLAMMLAAAGDAELDSPLTQFLPELSGTAGEWLSLRQLLSHCSGLASGIDETAVQTSDRRRWVMQHCRKADLVHPPGAVFSYSNIGYLLVGLLVELVTGMDWREAIGSVLLRPMGILPAFTVGVGSPARTVAAGHTDSDGSRRVQVLQSLSELEAPNGALAASAVDLVTFAASCLAEPGLMKEMLSDQLADIAVGSFGMADSWGLGWAIYRTGGTTWYGHDGNADGTSCHLRVEPETGTSIALTTNASTGMAMWEALIAGLSRIGLHVGSYPFSSLPGVSAPQPAPMGCEGRYRNGSSEVVIAAHDGGPLELLADGLLHASLTCHTGLRFTMGDVTQSGMRYVGRFIRNPQTGEIDLVQVAGRTARRIQWRGI